MMFKTSEAKIFGHHSSYEPNICVQHRHYRNISIKHGWESQAVQNIQIFFFFQSHLKRTIFLASHAFKSFISIIFGHHKQVSNVRSNHSNRTLLEIRVQTTITFRGFEDQGQVQNILRFFFFWQSLTSFDSNIRFQIFRNEQVLKRTFKSINVPKNVLLAPMMSKHVVLESFGSSL